MSRHIEVKMLISSELEIFVRLHRQPGHLLEELQDPDVLRTVLGDWS